MKVLFVAAEAAPYSKVGGLADFAGELPAALRELGVDVRLMIPRYGSTVSTASVARRIGHSISVPVGPIEEPAYVLEAVASSLPTYFVSNDQYFSSRERIYGFTDDAQRFMFFSRAVISALDTMDWMPDVVHVNDWHTAPVAVWLAVYGSQHPAYQRIATLFTVHNLAYQGIYGRLILSFGRMSKVPHLSIEQPGKVNWVAQGVAHSDLVNTVSPSYAAEIRSGVIDPTLAQIFADLGDRFVGVLSGIDTQVWNPSTDGALVQSFDSALLKLRSVNKTALQRELQLSVDPTTPLLGVVSRLDRTKGFDLLLLAIEQLLSEQDCQFVLLGAGEAEYETRARELQARYPRNVRAVCRFDDRLARRTYASLDLFVLPAAAEPSSTGVAVAMRYGAVPVVSSVGGLRDIVTDVLQHPAAGTGFTLGSQDVTELIRVLRTALSIWVSNAPDWHAIQRRGMKLDLSWQPAAKTYASLYEQATVVHSVSRSHMR